MKETLKAYTQVAVVFGAILTLINFFLSSGEVRIVNLKWHSALYFLAYLTLISTAGLMHQIFQVVQKEGNPNIPLWLTLKLVSLGGLFVLIWIRGPEIPQTSLFTGLSGVIIVPIAGSTILFQRNSRDA